MKNGYQSMEADIATVAASFGAVLPPGASFPVADFRDGVMSVKHETIAQSEASKVTTFSFLAIVQRLHELRPETVDHIARKQELLDTLPDLLLACDELEAEIATTRKAILDEKLWKVRALCKKQLEVLKALAVEERDAELRVQNAIAARDAVVKQLENLGEIEKSGKHVGRYASKAEYQKWNDQVAEVKQRSREIHDEMGIAVRERDMLEFNKIAPANAEMQRLGHEEHRIRQQLKGGNGFDAEFGLSIKPAGYVTAD